ncbi:unnamed protein product [Clavelina lepadiformis]|uniref:Major facilitator superfamily (MFS) profile domain-containing protein n=1 Tax=Clavelina lepadiformis TaxID=159417 RepID=A0ABP0FUC7_CLALP
MEKSETRNLLSNTDVAPEQYSADTLSSNCSRTKTSTFIYVLTFFSAIGGFLFGYDTGVISGAMIILKTQFNLNNIWQELIVSITVGCAAVFAMVGGYLNSCWGRRIVIILASAVFFSGSVVLASAYNKEMLLTGRAIVGIGIGLTSMTVPMYIAEVSPHHIRGRLVTVNNLFITGGQFFASCVDGFFSADKKDGWRYMLGLAAVPAFIQMVGFLFLPESPRWLMQKGKCAKAEKSLQKILSDERNVQNELEILKAAVTEEEKASSGSGGGVIQVLNDPAVRHAIFVGCGLQMFQQLSGINTVMYYSATIVQMSGVRNTTVAIWLAAALAFVNFAFTFVGVWLVEKMGRRLLSLLSIAGVAASLLFLAAGFYVSALHSPPVNLNSTLVKNNSRCSSFFSCTHCIRSQDCGYCFKKQETWNFTASCLAIAPDNPQLSENGDCSQNAQGDFTFAPNYCPTSYSWMALAGMVLYLAFFAPGMGPMPWTINSEIYPQWARSTGNAFSTTTNWVFNVIVSLTFLDVTQWLTIQGAFLLYTGLAFLGFVFIYLFLPETKNKPLEEVRTLFERGWFVPCHKEKLYHVILNQTQEGDETDEET